MKTRHNQTQSDAPTNKTSEVEEISIMISEEFNYDGEDFGEDFGGLIKKFLDWHTKQLAKEKMELVEELKETINICSDCKAEGISEMVNVHLNILIQALKSEEKEKVGE